jgi:hypothetical protein
MFVLQKKTCQNVDKTVGDAEGYALNEQMCYFEKTSATAVTEGGDFNLHFLKCEVSNKKQISNSIKMSKFRLRSYGSISCKSSLTKYFSG